MFFTKHSLNHTVKTANVDTQNYAIDENRTVVSGSANAENMSQKVAAVTRQQTNEANLNICYVFIQ